MQHPSGGLKLKPGENIDGILGIFIKLESGPDIIYERGEKQEEQEYSSTHKVGPRQITFGSAGISLQII